MKHDTVIEWTSKINCLSLIQFNEIELDNLISENIN